MKAVNFVKAIITKESVIKAAPAIAGALTVMLTPFGIGGKIVSGIAAYAIVRLIKANIRNEDLTTDEVVSEVANGALLVGAAVLIMSPTIVVPAVSVAVKLYLFSVLRKVIYDICASERNIAPFERHSFDITLSNKGRTTTFTI